MSYTFWPSSDLLSFNHNGFSYNLFVSYSYNAFVCICLHNIRVNFIKYCSRNPSVYFIIISQYYNVYIDAFSVRLCREFPVDRSRGRVWQCDKFKQNQSKASPYIIYIRAYRTVNVPDIIITVPWRRPPLDLHYRRVYTLHANTKYTHPIDRTERLR